MPSKKTTTPFHSSTPLFKVCPRCREEKTTSHANWYGQWVDRKFEVEDASIPDGSRIETQRIYVPRAYCRPCENANKAEARLVRKLIAAEPDPKTRAEWSATRKGPCAVCNIDAKQRSTLAVGGEPWVICAQCHSIIEACRATDDPTRKALDMWKSLRQHCIDEERIKAEVFARTDRRWVPYHHYNPDSRGVGYSHVVCMSLEKSWRAVYRFLRDHPLAD